MEEVREVTYFNDSNRTKYFINPTVDDLNSIISGVVGFVVDIELEKVYCWDMVSLPISFNIMDFFGVPFVEHNASGFYGIACMQSGKYVMVYCGFLDNYLEYLMDSSYILKHTEFFIENTKLQALLNNDWAWISQYIDANNYMNEARDLVKKAKEVIAMIRDKL